MDTKEKVDFLMGEYILDKVRYIDVKNILNSLSHNIRCEYLIYMLGYVETVFESQYKHQLIVYRNENNDAMCMSYDNFKLMYKIKNELNVIEEKIYLVLKDYKKELSEIKKTL